MSRISNLKFALFSHRKVLGDGGLLVFSGIFSKAAPFFLLPVLTRYLPPEEYGILGILSSISAIVVIFVGLQPHIFLIVKGSELEKDQLARYIGNAYWLALVGGVISFTVLWFIAPAFFPSALAQSWVICVIVLVGLMQVSKNILIVLLQLRHKAMGIALLQFLDTTVHYSIGIALIILWGFGWEGKYLGEVLSVCVVFVVAQLYFFRTDRINWIPHLGHLRELARYLFPLTFHALGLVMVGSIDRLLIAGMLNVEAAGLYTVSYAFGMILGIIHNALLTLWSPYFYKYVARESDHIKERIVEYTYVYIALSGVMLALFLITGPFIFRLMVDSQYHSGEHVMLLIAIAYTIEAVRKGAIGYLYHEGKTGLIAGLSLVVAALNIIFNVVLIPINGVVGAAQATVASFLVVTIVAIYFAAKLHPMPWRKALIKINALVKTIGSSRK